MQMAGLGRYDGPSYSTPDNISDHAEIKEFSALVMDEAKQVLDVYAIKRDSHYISNMWANITHPNHRHALHIHPNCLLSGIMYIKTPPQCGGTLFADPRPAARIFEPSFSQMNRFNMGSFVSIPEKGTMLMWPSFLPHAVERGESKSDEDRIVIAFNIMIRGRIDSRTASLVLN